MTESLTLAYQIRLYPTANKASVLPLYAQEFQRLHGQACEELLSRAWEQGHAGFPLGGLCQKGRGKFRQRALYRAWQDLRRQVKACKKINSRFKIPYLQAEMLSTAELQMPRKAKGWDYWIRIKGTPQDEVYMPANGHKALNRALAYTGAKLSKSAEIYQRRGVNKKVTISFQRSRLSHEARRIVLVAQQTGRAISLEDPARLIRWKGHAARFFGNRAVLLCQLMGVAVVLVPPPYTSQTCSQCGTRKSTVRLGEDFWCQSCRHLTDADVNAARVISRMARVISGHGEKNSLQAAA